MTEPPPADDSPDVPSEEEVASDLEAAALERDPRRYPSTIGGVCYLVVLVASAVAVFLVWSGDWRLGVRWLAGSLLAAALLRLVLPERDAGMLKVRHRALDVVLLVICGGLLLFLASTIPNQPL